MSRVHVLTGEHSRFRCWSLNAAFEIEAQLEQMEEAEPAAVFRRGLLRDLCFDPSHQVRCWRDADFCWKGERG